MDINIDDIIGIGPIIPIKTDELDCLIQELDVLMNTPPTEVFNAHKEFINLQYYVFKTRKSAENLEQDIKDLITQTVNVPENITVDVSVSFVKDEQSDIGFIAVKLTDNRTTDTRSKLYTFV